MNQKQVSANHYSFSGYMSQARWSSIWHQLDEIIQAQPRSVLEIGPGIGLTKAVGDLYGVSIETVDIDPELKPDYLCAPTNLPFEEDQFELSCAFQMLEHLPYGDALLVLKEMARISSKVVVISLPDARRAWQFTLEVPRIGLIKFLIPRPYLRSSRHVFDGEHYWELNKRGFSLEKFILDAKQCGLQVRKTYRVHTYSYHRFFVFDVR